VISRAGSIGKPFVLAIIDAWYSAAWTTHSIAH
jgi:hypothetical protein